MPSKNRIAAYPPDHIYERLGDFAKEHKLSESKALIQILAEYFCVAPNVAQEVSYRYATIEQVQDIEKKILDLSKLIGELQSKLPSSSEVGVAKATNELNDDLQGELLAPTADSGSSIKLQPLQGIVLSKRLGKSSSFASASKNKKKFKSDRAGLTEFFRKHDPDGIGWEYREGTNLYHPV